MANSITIDTTIGIEDIDGQLKEVERRIKSLKKQLERQKGDLDYYNAKAAETKGTAEADSWGKKILAAEDAIGKTEHQLALATGQQTELSLKAQETATATDRWEIGINNASVAMDKLKKRLIGLAKRVLIFSVFTKLLRSVRSYFADAIQQSTEASTAIAQLKSAFQTLAMPIIQAVIPALIQFVNWLTKVVMAVAQLVNWLLGKSVKDMQALAKSGKSAAASTAKAASNLAGFDTINQLGSNSGGAGGGEAEISGLGDAAELTNNEMLKTLAELAGIITGVILLKNILKDPKKFFGNIAETFASIKEKISASADKLKLFAEWALLIGSAITFVVSYINAWSGGIETFGQIVTLFASLVGLVVAINLLFGAHAAQIALIVGGITLLVLGIKDVIENGWNLHNLLVIIGGLLAAGLGVAALTSSWIPLIIAGILSVVAAIIANWDKIKAWAQRVWQKILDWLYTASATVEKVCMAIGEWFSNVFGKIKDTAQSAITFIKDKFVALGETIKTVFTNAWQKVKDVFSTGGQIFSGIKEGIADFFRTCVNKIIDGLNTVIAWPFDRINGILNTIKSITVLGAQPFFNLWGWSPLGVPQIPYLAQGAVIPPNRQFMAVLGDQKSGTNIETPLETMIEAFRQAQSDQSINITFNGDLAGLAAILGPQIALQNKRRGR